jgi:hypothetical protein
VNEEENEVQDETKKELPEKKGGKNKQTGK